MIKLHKNKQLEYSINIVPKEISKSHLENSKPVLYTSSGDFSAYDDEMYDFMTNDLHRNQLYEAEINEQVEGKVVLDIGTGAHANWALCAAECGAKKVYAIESIDEAYHKAKQRIANSQYVDKIILINGLSTKVELPEKVDVCISEILGCPASSEAVISVLSDAEHRFLKDDAKFIIDRCVSKIAVCMLGEEFKSNLGICETDIKYLDRIFTISGRPFDVRVVIENFPRDWKVSSDAIMEDIQFNKSLQVSNSVSISVRIFKDSKIDGMISWIEIFGTKKNRVLDTLEKHTNWMPVFFPVFSPQQVVRKGDIVNFQIDTYLESGGINPDYHFYGNISRADATVTEFEFTSSYISENFRANPFYKTLFGS